MSQDKSYSLLDTNSEELLREDAGKEKKKPMRQENNKNSLDRKKRGRIIYFSVVILISAVLAAIIFPKMVMTINENLILQTVINETDITNAEDAVYSASYKSAHQSATVNVTIENGLMTAINLTDYTGIDPARARLVIDRVLKYQMLNVPEDDIGTQSTDIIVLKAIEKTLEGAVIEK